MSWLERSHVAIWLACLLAALAAAPPVLSQDSGPSPSLQDRLGWEDWFYGQRLYGLGYIPDDALSKAESERDGLRSASPYSPQSLRTSSITAGEWFSLGPSPINSVQNDLVSGRVTSLAIDPRNPSTVYLAAAGGGVWKSTDRGVRWIPLTDRLPSLASGAVAVDPFFGEVWYGSVKLKLILI